MRSIQEFHFKLIPLLVFALFLSNLLSAQIEYFPERHEWEERDASDLSINESVLEEAIEFAKANEYTGPKDIRRAILKGFEREPYHKLLGPTKKRGGPAGVVIKNGYIVAKWGDVDRVDMTFSVTKSYLSTMAGLALDEGLIEDVHDPVHEYVWDGTFRGEHNSKVTWDHLLNQSSDWSGELFGIKDWADRPPKEGDLDDWRFRELRDPGSHYEYNDVRVNVLAYSLLQVWRRPLPMVLKEKIMDPIGASTTWRWHGYDHSWTLVDGIKMQSVSGGGHSGGGIFINTLDHARFGLLFLNNGKWNDQQLISEDWVKAVQQPSQANESYGYMWWLNRGERTNPDAPSDIYYASGFGGNYIFVDQEHDVVIVTRWLNPPAREEFLSRIMKAF